MDTSRGSKIMEKKILILTSFVSGMGEWKRSLNELIRFYLKIKNTQHVLFLSVAVRVI